MIKKTFLGQGILLLLISVALASNYKVNPETQFFIDQYGRSVLFHGVNAIYKPFPYYPPILDQFDSNNSLSDQDFQNLRQWGFNSMRLYVAWQGTESIRGEYNYTYLGIVREIVRTAAKYNISIILDAHQDLGSPKFCGEGLPDWAVNRTNFPFPLPIHIDYDAEGHADIDQCLKTSFAEFMATTDVQHTFKSLYTNVDGIADAFASFWQVVADFFKDEPNVLGYELINEPPASSFAILANIENQDTSLLQPFYQKINDQIRAVDNETIIFFEPTVTDIISIGFTEGPGGPEYNDRQAFSYHVYCGIVNGAGVPKIGLLCDAIDALTLKLRTDAAKRLGLATFLTEFGALEATPKGVKEINRVTDMADAHIHSWSYWQFKYYGDYTTAAQPPTIESFYDNEGNLQITKVQALARSYAYATCGTPTSLQFDQTTGDFSYAFEVSFNCSGQGTEFFLSEDYYYPNGFTATFEGCEGCSLSQLNGERNYYVLNVPNTVSEGTQITVEVKAA